MEILCFFAGVAFFYLKNPYPLYGLGLALFFRQKLSLLLCFLAAILISLLHQWFIADSNMPKTNLIKKGVFQGEVISIPIVTPFKTQFQFSAHLLNNHSIEATLLLSCYQKCPTIHPGQQWQLTAKLKQPMNFGNPGGFDFVSYLNSRHIQWLGTIYQGSFKAIEAPLKPYTLIAIRDHLSHIFYELYPDLKTLGIFEALTLGLTTHIDKAQWDLFRRTGTIHLIDISGEHIALVAGFCYGLILFICKRFSRLCLLIPAPKIASGGAILISIAYALIAGFAVPTQRALITCCLIFGRHFSNQRVTMWQAWRYALLMVLVIEPHAVFMLGFYFSFIAVVILILINQRIKTKGLIKMLSMQLACMLGLMPLSLYWFSYASINGLIANLIAIPWVGFLIVPLALIIAFLSPWFIVPGSMALLNALIVAFLVCLRWIDQFEMININFTFTEALLPLAIMAAMAIMVFLPLARFIPAASLVIFAGFFPRYEKISSGHATIDILDVGQGLSVVIRTRHHVLIYDTGMKFYHASDMGKLVIIPYLKTLNIKSIDKIIISHPDLDHRGGLASLTAQYPHHELIVDDPLFYHRGVSCHTYPAWDWDGIHFQFFPILTLKSGKNNHSCVLKVTNKSGQVLLSGDIEQPAEDYLTRTYGSALQSSILIIPHHGSKTSSSNTFLNLVAPLYAIASYGFDNRYHFPHDKTIQHYVTHHIPVYNTVECGMVRIKLTEEQVVKPTCYRSP